jgi:hypothetical protein
VFLFCFQLENLINSTAQKAAAATLQALSGPNSPFGSPAMSLTNENFSFTGPGAAAGVTFDATKTAGLDPNRLHSVRGHQQQVQADVHQYPPGAVGGTLPKTKLVSTPSQTTATTTGISGEGMVTSSFSNTGQFNTDDSRYRSNLLDAHQHAAKDRPVQTDQDKGVDDDIEKKPLALDAAKESFF